MLSKVGIVKSKGIWLPIEVIRNKTLSNNEKFLLMEIVQLTMLDKGCIASNRHFSELFQINKKGISRLINSLIKKDFIESIIKKGSRNKVRIITLKEGTPKMMVRYPRNDDRVPPKCLQSKENKTVNKTKSIIKDKYSLKLKTISEFIPLSFEFHKTQKESGLQHIDFKNPITEKSKIVIAGAEVLEKIHRLDKEPITEINKVLNFILLDSFWSKQIISLTGIRLTKNNGNTKFFNVKNGMKSNVKQIPETNPISLKELGYV